MAFIDPDDVEACAIDSAQKLTFAYLEDIKKFNVDSNDCLVIGPLSGDEWHTMIRYAIENYVSQLVDRADKARRALEKVQPLP